MNNNWIDNYKIRLNYICNSCKKENTFNSFSKNFDEDKKTFLHSKCNYCGIKALKYKEYQGDHILGYTKVEYEQNGLKAIRTRLGDGRVTYHSMTRERYEKTGNTESVYAKI